MNQRPEAQRYWLYYLRLGKLAHCVFVKTTLAVVWVMFCVFAFLFETKLINQLCTNVFLLRK